MGLKKKKNHLSSDCYIGLVTVFAESWRIGGLEPVGSQNTKGSTLWIYTASLLLFAVVLAQSMLWACEKKVPF